MGEFRLRKNERMIASLPIGRLNKAEKDAVSQTLQQVTDIGSTTTKTITVGGINENDVYVATTNYTAPNQGQTIIATQPITIYLPQIDSISKKITISNQSSGEVTVSAYSGDLVHGDTSMIISFNKSTAQLKSTSLGWVVV